MTTQIVIIGDPSATTLPGLACPVSGIEWRLSRLSPFDPVDFDSVGMVLFDVATIPEDRSVYADIVARTADVPRLAVAAGEFGLNGVETLDAARYPDLSAEVFSRLERQRIACKVRWLDGLGGNGFVGQIIDLVLTEMPKSVAAVEAAVAVGDARAVAGTAHQMKSSAAYVGAQTISDIANRIERDAREEKTGDLAVLAAELRAAWLRAAPILSAHRNHTAG